MRAVTEFQPRVIIAVERDCLDGYRARARDAQNKKEIREIGDRELSSSWIGINST